MFIEVFEGKSVSSKVVDEIEIYRAASLVLVTQKRSNFSRFIYIYIYVYHISIQMLDARRLTRPSPPKIPSDNCYNFTVLLSYSTETQKHAQLHIDYTYIRKYIYLSYIIYLHHIWTIIYDYILSTSRYVN